MTVAGASDVVPIATTSLAPRARLRSRGAVRILLLSIGAAASLLLTLEHLGAIQLPGCGDDNGCAHAAASAWGSVPFFEWPVPFLGLAYFLCVLAACCIDRGGLPAIVRHAVDVGAIISLLFLGVLVRERIYCGYCIAAHFGNLGFWFLVRGDRPTGTDETRPMQRRSSVVAAFVLVAVTAALAVTRAVLVARARQAEEIALASSIAEVIARAPAGDVARLVVFMDYQCEACRRIDRDVAESIASNADVAISIKHFPMCGDCNRRIHGAGPHPNACWAARAAEATRAIAGADAFWKMHRWLVAHEGAFTEATLAAAAAEIGVESKLLARTMAGEETLARVRADADEGARLGVAATPTVFLDGIELHGRLAEHAVPRAVAARLAAHPLSASARADRAAAVVATGMAFAGPSVDPSPTPPDVVATVAGEPILAKEIEASTLAALDRVEFERYRILRSAIEQLGAQRLIEREAVSRKLSVEELRRREIDDLVAEPTRAEIEEVFHFNTRRAGTRSLVEVAPEITESLRAQRRHAQEQRYVGELATRYGFHVDLLPPRLHVDVPPGAPVRGAADAPVTIVEFADFECPFCRELQPTLRRLLDEHVGKVQLCFRDFPLASHPRARAAATAARAAAEQGRFWEYFDALMAEPVDLSDAVLEKTAAALGLDVEKLRASIAADRHLGEIDADLARGRELGVTATPTLFINGRPWTGSLMIEELTKAAEAEIEATRSGRR